MLWGGSGKDALYGGTGNDRIHGGSGDDKGDERTIQGLGKDTIRGDSGADDLYGGTGHRWNVSPRSLWLVSVEQAVELLLDDPVALAALRLEA